MLAATGVTSALALSGCGTRPQAEPEYVSPYDWTGLFRDGEKLTYYEDGILKSKWGIDVSEHQHWIDWDAVSTAGLDFAFIRIGYRGATEGKLTRDDYFTANYRWAAKTKLEISGYFFSQATTAAEAKEEAAFTLELVKEAEAAGCKFHAIAYDHETVDVEGARANELENEQLSSNVLAFCDEIAKAGYVDLLYGNQRDLMRVDKRVRDTVPIWLAEYDVSVPTAPIDFVIWQYSNSGTIPGISTPVDLNLWIEQDSAN